MKDGKTLISQASSYREIGEFWDTHDLDDHAESLGAREAHERVERRTIINGLSA